MARYINLEDVIEEINDAISNISFTSPYQNDIGTMVSGMERVLEIVEDALTVDVVEVVHGRWIERPLDNFRKYEVKCSECGFVGIGNYDQYLEPYDFNYCPNCGAKMDGDGNGN